MTRKTLITPPMYVLNYVLATHKLDLLQPQPNKPKLYRHLLRKHTQNKQFFLPWILCFIGFFAWNPSWAQWHTLAPGFEYQDLNNQSLKPWAHIHVFRIDLKRYRLAISLAKQLNTHDTTGSITQFAAQTGASLAINGGFFDKDYRPLGLRMQSGKILNPIRNISWWGIFYISNNRARVVSRHQFPMSHKIQFAIQSGPRLIINGRIPHLKPGNAERSAIGITSEGHIILLATEGTPLSTEKLATLMKKQPLNCNYALNLDGGSSTQLFVNTPRLKLNVSSFSQITDAIIVIPKPDPFKKPG